MSKQSSKNSVRLTSAATTSATPFYDPTVSYQENFDQGPFGEFVKPAVIKREQAQPQFQFLGHQVYTPFGIPAGPLINSNFVKSAFAKGFDICVYKTVRTKAHPCHPHPNILAVKVKGDLTLSKAQQKLRADENYAPPLSITNSFGVPCPDPDWWQLDMAKANESAGTGQVLIGGFQGTGKPGGTAQDLIADYVQAAKLVKETGVPILIANLSCPNEGKSNLLCFDVPMVKKIAFVIKQAIGNTPLLLKLAYFQAEQNLEELVREVGCIADGFIAINTIPAQIVDKDGNQALPGEGRAVSGVCGASIKWAGLEMTQRLLSWRAKLDLRFAVIGVGGVMTVDDYVAYQALGPDAVLSATGAMWNPELGQEIYQNLYSNN